MRRTLLAAAIGLAFASPAVLWANPVNTNEGSTGAAQPGGTDTLVNGSGDISQTATAISRQKSNQGAQANENSNATYSNTQDNVGNDASQRTTQVTKSSSKARTWWSSSCAAHCRNACAASWM